MRDFLLLLRAVAGGLPRGLTAELLRSTRVRWSALLDAGANGTFPGAQAETWSRKAGMLGELVEWTSDLPDWAGRLQLGDGATEDERAQAERLARARHDEALRIGRALEVLVRRIDADTPRRWSDHASHLHCQFQELIETSAPE